MDRYNSRDSDRHYRDDYNHGGCKEGGGGYREGGSGYRDGGGGHRDGGGSGYRDDGYGRSQRSFREDGSRREEYQEPRRDHQEPRRDSRESRQGSQMYGDRAEERRGHSPPRQRDDHGREEYPKRERSRDRSRSPRRRPAKEPCRFFFSARGCRDGDNCRYSHDGEGIEEHGPNWSGQWAGANGLRSLSGSERLDYFRTRLGAGESQGGEHPGLGCATKGETSTFNEGKAIEECKRMAQGGNDLVQEIMKKRKGAEWSERDRRQDRQERKELDYTKIESENYDGEPVEDGAVEELSADATKAYIRSQMAQHQDLDEQQHHASGHPLLRGDTVFSAAAQDDFVSRMAARNSNDFEALKSAMAQAVKKEDYEEAGRLKRRIEAVLAKQEADKKKALGAAPKKKGTFMQRQLSKIKKVQTQNEAQRKEEEGLSQMDGPLGDYHRFMKELDQTACHSSGARGDNFFAISCNTQRIV